MPCLFLKRITKPYPLAVANDEVSLTVPPGKIRVVMGKNGAGKSTRVPVPAECGWSDFTLAPEKPAF